MRFEHLASKFFKASPKNFSHKSDGCQASYPSASLIFWVRVRFAAQTMHHLHGVIGFVQFDKKHWDELCQNPI